jgi:hypothetical protein
MHRLLDSFKLGFTSDRIVSVLSKIEKGKPLTESEKKVIEEGVGLIDLVLQGREQMDTGQYGSNALESLKMYNKSLIVVLDMPEMSGEINATQVKRVFSSLREKTCKVIDGKATKNEMKDVKFFFNSLREATLDDSTTIMNGLNDSRSKDRWELALET